MKNTSAFLQEGVRSFRNCSNERFDYIFFTGGTHLGRIVMEKASRHLTPVTLELGGKSPCIVDADANIDIAARRITFGKFLNSGQTCIAPDYLLAHTKIKKQLIERIRHYITLSYGQDPQTSPDYGRIINHERFEQIVSIHQNRHGCSRRQN